MDELPKPLTPEDCDLRKLEFMPLDVARLRDSDLAGTKNAEAFRAAMMAFCASWHQVPAASLPNDEEKVARLLGCGVTQFRRMKAEALRGWVLCSDGRLYHPVTAGKALKAFDQVRKYAQRAKSGANGRWKGTPSSDEHYAEKDNENNDASMLKASHKQSLRQVIGEGELPIDTSVSIGGAAPPPSDARTPHQASILYPVAGGAGEAEGGGDLSPPPPTDPGELLRRQLWNEGRGILGRLSPGMDREAMGKLIGKAVKDLGGDHARVVQVLRDAESAMAASRIAGNPVDWIRGAVRQAATGAKPSGRPLSRQDQARADAARMLAELDAEEASLEPRTVKATVI